MLELRRPQLHVGSIPDTSNFRGLVARAPGFRARCSPSDPRRWIGVSAIGEDGFESRLFEK
jgi:hypothetical protein